MMAPRAIPEKVAPGVSGNRAYDLAFDEQRFRPILNNGDPVEPLT
jgi:hypothetical protein